MSKTWLEFKKMAFTLPSALVVFSLMMSTYANAEDPRKCGTIYGNVDIWCYKSLCKAFLQVQGAEHGIDLGQVDDNYC